jgi:hypothetical protein
MAISFPGRGDAMSKRSSFGDVLNEIDRSIMRYLTADLESIDLNASEFLRREHDSYGQLPICSLTRRQMPAGNPIHHSILPDDRSISSKHYLKRHRWTLHVRSLRFSTIHEILSPHAGQAYVQMGKRW